MDNNYNDILKEKKVYKEEVVENRHPVFKRFLWLGIFLSIVIIGISYIIYYKTVLTNESIFLNNISKILTDYSVLYKSIDFDYDLSSDYTLDSNIRVGDSSYKYSFIKDSAKVKRSFSNLNNVSSYYFDGDSSYVKYSKIGDSYIVKDYELYTLDDYNNEYLGIKDNFYGYFVDFLLNGNLEDIYKRFYNVDNYKQVLDNIQNNYNNITSDKYIRKVYFDDKRPVVEVNLVLDREDINNILGRGINNLELKDDYSITVTMKNGAIMNDIKEIKLVINNKTTKIRKVINYKKGTIEYSDNKRNISKFVLANEDSNFSLKYYKDDVLYSVLSGGEDNNKYVYTYQVIDRVYNIKLTIGNDSSNYSFLLEANIENDANSILIDGTFSNGGEISEDINNVVYYDNLNDIQKNIFNSSIKDVLFS